MDAHHCNSTPARDDAPDRAHATRDFSTLFDFLPIGAYRSTPQGQLLCANPALVQLNGYATEAELIAAIHDIGSECYVTPQARQDFCEALERDGFVRSFITEAYRHKTRERVWVNENAHMVRGAQGRAQFYEGTVEDITERAQAAAELRQRDEIWKLALESTGDGVWDWNIGQDTAALSQRCLEMYGYGAEALHGQSPKLDERTHPDDLAQMLRDRQAHLDGVAPAYVNEHRVRCADGSWKWILTRGMVISRSADGTPLRMVGTHTDITQRKENEALIWHQAHFDALTGLPNRRMLHDRLAQQMLHCDRHREHAYDGKLLAVLFIDLDHFKEVNDTLGHAGGDRLLVEAAQRLTRCVRATDTGARMGGDEFTVLLPALHGAREVERIVQAILAEMAREFLIGPERAFVTASIGLTFYPGEARNVDDLLRQADQALYLAKGTGRNGFAYFTPALQEGAQQRARLAHDLRLALAGQQLSVHYQPIVALATGRVLKAEALLRWHHPTRGAVSPAEFVPIAEANGLIVEIGEWVFLQAARQALAWRTSLAPDFQVAINKSPVQFHRPQSKRRSWMERIATLRLPAGAVTVEITEGLLLDPGTEVAQHLVDLRASGLTVALDDFGTGYCSLAYLQRYDIDYLKIDRSFVHGLAPRSNDLALCKAMIVMAHQLGIAVIAEGVETEAQRALLAKAGCDYAQGFLFSPALAPEQFEAWVAEHNAR
jgi:diguanylate cyclase (GGDEF)-like protein/PAS domain S-box-containing protein